MHFQVKTGTTGLMYNVLKSLVTESITHVEQCQVRKCTFCSGETLQTIMHSSNLIHNLMPVH